MQIAFGRVRRKTSPAKKGRIYTKYCKVHNLGAIGNRTISVNFRKNNRCDTETR